MGDRTNGPARARTATREFMTRANMADAGMMAVMTSSALMMSCAALAKLLDQNPNLIDLVDFGGTAHQSMARDTDARNAPASFAIERLEGPAEQAQPVRLAIPPASPNLVARDLAHLAPSVPASVNVAALDTNYDVSEPMALDAYAVSFDETGRLILHAPRPASDRPPSNNSAAEARSDLQTNEGLRDRLHEIGQIFVADLRVSPSHQSDVAVFVAADDETLSWALNRTNPNHGTLAYADDQVELGDLAIGVSMSMGEARVAAAYVEREYIAPFRGANGVDESFAGLTLTYRN
ncbi:hypothetical protein [Vitreimonas flagellata]|uniref:hypothetical protein n=1 Tax=Vitreimonas flagellata TaxID=2560861 RepID=UPI001074CF8E|nr:hypothetical protein [Vitreimonas flagellata]